MGVDTSIDITTEDLQTVLALLQRHLPGTAAWTYGSRVKWTSTPKSDLDLVVFATPEQRRQVGDLREAFEESNLRFRVDLFVWDDVPESFRNQIQNQHVALANAQRARQKPELWNAAILDELTDAIIDRRGVTPKKLGSSFVSEGYRVISAKTIKDNRVDLSIGQPRFVDDVTYRNWMKTPLQADDVVLTSEAPTGKPAYITHDAQWCLGQRLFGIRTTKHRLYGRFLFYALQSLDVQQDLLSRATGTTAEGIRQVELRRVLVPLPPLPEQRAIAHVLGTLDDKIELNRRMNATLEAMARALFKSWFVDFDPVRAKMEGRDMGLPKDIADLFPDRLVESELGEIPRGWMVRTLGDLCHKPQYGYTASAKSEPVGPQFLRITDINKKSWVSWSRVPYCEATNDELLKYRLNKGEVLIARMADPGHGILVEDDVEAVFASYLIRSKPIETHHARLLQYWLKSDAYWQLVTGQAAGTTRVSLNARVLSQFPLVVPPNSVASAFAEAVGALRHQLVRSAREMDSLAALRDTLLPKLVSGELRLRPSAPALRDVDRTRAGRVGPRRLNSE